MENFDRYFLHEKRIFLENINYEVITPEPVQKEMRLNCKDTILAQLKENSIKISFNRTLNFEPEGLYSLSVTFSVILIFDPSTKNEIQWDKIDIAGEFRKSCPSLLTALMSRTSLLISQITASSGQLPVVTPATPVPNIKKD